MSDDERFQLVNVTRWDSRQAQQAATGTPQLRFVADDAEPEPGAPHPGFYRVAASLDPGSPM